MSSSSSSVDSSNFTTPFYSQNTTGSSTAYKPSPTTCSNIETVLTTFLINHYRKIIPLLPFNLTNLRQIINQIDESEINYDDFDNACLNLASCLPTSFVVDKMCSKNTAYSSRFQLTFYNVDILRLWISGLSDTDSNQILQASDEVVDHPYHSDPNHNQSDTAYADNSNLYQILYSIISSDDSFFSRMKKSLESLLIEPTARDLLLKDQILKTNITKPYVEICPAPKRNECLIQGKLDCLRKIHFEPIITKNTDTSIGDCSYLDTCFKGKGCKYIHYRITFPDQPQNRIESEQRKAPTDQSEHNSANKRVSDIHRL